MKKAKKGAKAFLKDNGWVPDWSEKSKEKARANLIFYPPNNEMKKIVGFDELHCMFFMCPGCKNKVVADGYRFCPNCGIKIKWVGRKK